VEFGWGKLPAELRVIKTGVVEDWSDESWQACKLAGLQAKAF
jgi:hypothetical protein